MAEHRCAVGGHLQADEAPAGTEHAGHLGDGGGVVGHVAQAERDRAGVEGVVGKGECHRIADEELDIGIARASLGFGGGDHLRREVEPDHLACAGGPDIEGDIARPGRDIEHLVAHRGGAFGDLLAPADVHAEGHQVVHQVVARHDAVEHGAHGGRFGDRAGFAGRLGHREITSAAERSTL